LIELATALKLNENEMGFKMLKNTVVEKILGVSWKTLPNALVLFSFFLILIRNRPTFTTCALFYYLHEYCNSHSLHKQKNHHRFERFFFCPVSPSTLENCWQPNSAEKL